MKLVRWEFYQKIDFERDIGKDVRWKWFGKDVRWK